MVILSSLFQFFVNPFLVLGHSGFWVQSAGVKEFIFLLDSQVYFFEEEKKYVFSIA